MLRPALAWCVWVLPMISGCFGGYDGPERAAISGTVIREGIPVDKGMITFTPKAGGPGASIGITDGKYEFTGENGPVGGAHDVRIVQSAPMAAVPEGEPLKDAEVLPETRFKGKQPPDGFHFTQEVTVDSSEPVDFEITAESK